MNSAQADLIWYRCSLVHPASASLRLLTSTRVCNRSRKTFTSTQARACLADRRSGQPGHRSSARARCESTPGVPNACMRKGRCHDLYRRMLRYAYCAALVLPQRLRDDGPSSRRQCCGCVPLLSESAPFRERVGSGFVRVLLCASQPRSLRGSTWTSAPSQCWTSAPLRIPRAPERHRDASNLWPLNLQRAS